MLLHIYTKRKFENTSLERQITQIYRKSRQERKLRVHETKSTELQSLFCISLLKCCLAPDQ